jgi:ribosomal protein S18 acetylase RimI-like enzyme
LTTTHHPMTERPPALSIRQATDTDIAQITATLVDAFLDTPDAWWLIPDHHNRQTIYPRLCEVLAGHTLRHAHIDITADGSGVAVWQPVTGPVPDLADHHRPLAAACGPYAARFQTLHAVLAAHHPQQPHHYLAYLGVASAHQCQGIGSALLAHHHTELDAAGRPAYLVAVSSGSRDLYLRHGYHLHGAAPFHLPDGGPPMWPMRRNPQPAPDSRRPTRVSQHESNEHETRQAQGLRDRGKAGGP